MSKPIVSAHEYRERTTEMGGRWMQTRIWYWPFWQDEQYISDSSTTLESVAKRHARHAIRAARNRKKFTYLGKVTLTETEIEIGV